MFPFEGAKATEAEARRFYTLFNAQSDLAFITGPGGHGNLRPILPQILAFFAAHLHPDTVYAKNLPPITDPFTQPPNKPGARPAFPPPPPVSLVQVTPTGQLSSSYSNIATVFTLNQARAATITTPHPKTLAALQQAIREVTHAETHPGSKPPLNSPNPGPDADHIRHRLLLHSEQGIDLAVEFFRPTSPGKHPEILVLRDDLDQPDESPARAADLQRFHDLAVEGTAVFVVCPRPSPPGTEETKAPILGPFYLTGLRSQLVGKTLLGMRVDDVLHAIDFAADGYTVDPSKITAEASGNLSLVLLHAAVLDPRLKHITLSNILPSYRSLIATPLPVDAPQNILPGVLRHYDIPDLIRALGARVTVTTP